MESKSLLITFCEENKPITFLWLPVVFSESAPLPCLVPQQLEQKFLSGVSTIQLCHRPLLYLVFPKRYLSSAAQTCVWVPWHPSWKLTSSRMIAGQLSESVSLGCGSHLSDVEINLFVFILLQEPRDLAQGIFTEVFPMQQQAHCGAVSLSDGRNLQRQQTNTVSHTSLRFLYISQYTRSFRYPPKTFPHCFQPSKLPSNNV